MIRPIQDRLIARKLEGSRVTTSGLILMAKEKAMLGLVTSAPESSQFKADDVILFGRYSPEEFIYNKTQYFTIKEDEILATSDDNLQKVIPVRSYVLVERDPDVGMVGNVFIPETSREKAQRGTVMAIGGDVGLVKVGDSIMYGLYSHYELKTDLDLLIIKEDDMHMVVEDV